MIGMNPWMPAIAMGITVFHALGMGVGSVVFNASRLAPVLPLSGGGYYAARVKTRPQRKGAHRDRPE